MNVICILGNHLFDPKHIELKPKDTLVFMREDHQLCTHFKYHKHKIIFFLSAMRHFAEELKSAGYKVHYEKLGEHKESYTKRLLNFLKKNNCKKLSMFEIEDKFFETEIESILKNEKIELNVLSSPMFLTTRSEFLEYLSKSKKPFMKTFYESQRKRLKILVDKKLSPVGGQWSFDEDNRKVLPRNDSCPTLPDYKTNKIDKEVGQLVQKEFGKHPGKTEDFWLPTDRKGAEKWLDNFLENRFELFGPYEDSLSKEEQFLYHSVLTPFLNTGLLTPDYCISKALKFATKNSIPINSCEGFIRQIIGWREFVRGIYQNYSEEQDQKNHFGHSKKLSNKWYSGDTGIEPLDDVIKKVLKYSYAHHIERLMVVGSLMLLLEVDPKEAHRWFMEMFIDSSDWVMGPNVYGMALFSDGGIFATKPYICGSNYYKKMSHYKSKDWCDGVDGLYWLFIKKNKETFARNPRMSMMVKMLDKISPERLKHLESESNKLRKLLVI